MLTPSGDGDSVAKKLTKRTVDAAKYEGDGKSRDFRWCGETRGFGIRIYPSGAKSFVVHYRTRGGRLRLLTLGAYGALTVEQGRGMAKKELAKVEDGKDPLEERRAVRRGATVKEFADQLITKYRGARGTLRESTRKEYKRKLDLHILPAIGSKKLVEVTRDDIARIRLKLADRPVEANRTIEIARLLFNVAKEWPGGYVPGDHANPAAGHKPYAENERERWVTPEELPRLVEAIDKDGSLLVRAAIKL
ncbi:MAG: DUF4102 domain-containing protein, partial [Gemmatimonas sp.]|nr:DUF4102 domain-containing protein [Gemmatimonas sp.]